MANFVDNATINLSVNGKQANLVMDTLREKAAKLKAEMDKAASSGQADKAKKLRQQYKQLEQTIKQGTTETLRLEQAMRRLDKASPSELRKTLNSLQRQLNGIERGSAAWNAHVEKIRRVKEAMQDLNKELSVGQSRWERFNSWLNDCQPLIMGAAAALTGLVLAGKKAVTAYAEMEQEMANVRKYTGMTAQEVERLNEAFLEINTRTSREELNKLAQEAGRLGKTSQEDVLGFVRAADKINVALDDLGAGATLTLSKLTGIFGDEKRYGTEKALLKVGSVINELSQNCSASAPYIANFTERLGGVGAQAGMTIQQIMGFAAVLDSNSQKVEASATALSQIIVRLYQSPEKYAKVAGMDAKRFADLMRKDANAAVLEFLQTLNKAGGMDVLSPMFKDMGENGSRAIAALSTLATNIDAVKQQQQAANKAFEEGTSIQKEFDVQNNTVMAGMEKARKNINELAVQLGEKLQPVMTHIYSSSSIALRVLKSIIDFTFNHKTALLSLTAALVAYNVAAKIAVGHKKAMIALTAANTAVMKAERAVLLLGNAAFSLLTGNVTRAAAAWRAFNTVVKLNPFGLAATAIVLLGTAIYKLTSRTDEFVKSSEDLIKKSSSVSESLIKEQRELDKLYEKMMGAKKGSEDYQKAKSEIIKQYGKYLSGLIDEKGEIINLAVAYDTLTEAIRRSAQERNIANAKENLDTKFTETTAGDLAKLQRALESYGASAKEAAMITQAISQSVIEGSPISESTRNLIAGYAAGLPVADATGKQYSNKAQRVAAKAGLALNAPDDPLKILDRLNLVISDYTQKSSVLDSMEKSVNPTKDYSDDDLRAMYKSISLAIETGKGGVFNLPAAFIDEAKISEAKKTQAVSETEKSPVSPFSLKHPASLIPDSQATPAMPLGHEVIAGAQSLIDKSSNSLKVSLTMDDLKSVRTAIAHELNLRGAELMKTEKSGNNNNNNNNNPNNYNPEEKESELAKRFKEELKKIEAAREEAVEKATVLNASGQIDYYKYLKAKHDAQIKFYDDSAKIYEKWNKTEEEGYKELLRKKAEEQRSWNNQMSARSIEEVKRNLKREEAEILKQYAGVDESAYKEWYAKNSALHIARLKAMYQELSLSNKGSKEAISLQMQIADLNTEWRIEQEKFLVKEARRLEQEYKKISPAERMKAEMEILKRLLEKNMITENQFNSFSDKLTKKYAPGNKEKSGVAQAKDKYKEDEVILTQMRAQGLISEDEYNERTKKISKDLNDALLSGLANCESEWVSSLTKMYMSWADFAEALKDPDADPFSALASGLQATAAVMGAVIQSISALTEAEVAVQTKAIEQRYEKEKAFAEGNAYLTNKLEKKKQKDIAKLKSDAAKKNFAMQVAATVASTAANAVSAYGAALQVGGLAGLILAPIAAGLALAQGALQIAVLKKQQQVADSTGYSEGGFTRKGRKDEPAGVVHAGEWVASQKLVNNPKTRPVIDALEYAQRSNVMPALAMEDVSRSISAPLAISMMKSEPAIIRETAEPAPRSDNAGSSLEQTLERLNNRLDEPFITHNSIEGPFGFKQAKDEYDRLIRNKSK